MTNGTRRKWLRWQPGRNGGGEKTQGMKRNTSKQGRESWKEGRERKGPRKRKEGRESKGLLEQKGSKRGGREEKKVEKGVQQMLHSLQAPPPMLQLALVTSETHCLGGVLGALLCDFPGAIPSNTSQGGLSTVYQMWLRSLRPHSSSVKEKLTMVSFCFLCDSERYKNHLRFGSGSCVDFLSISLMLVF